MLNLYKINPDYLKFMHRLDYRINVKNNRPFVGILTMVNGIRYVLPLTSQTTSVRRAMGKEKRAAIITTFVKDSKGNEISNILYNNMFPVKSGTYEMMNIDPRKDTYETNEIRYIRKYSAEIIKKAEKVHYNRIMKRNPFLLKACCDFQKLENSYLDFEFPSENTADGEAPCS